MGQQQFGVDCDQNGQWNTVFGCLEFGHPN